MPQESLQYADIDDALGVTEIGGNRVRPEERLAQAVPFFGAFRIGGERVRRLSPEGLRCRFSDRLVLLGGKGPEGSFAIESHCGKNVRAPRERRVIHGPVGDIDGPLRELEMVPAAFWGRRFWLELCAFRRRAAAAILPVHHTIDPRRLIP